MREIVSLNVVQTRLTRAWNRLTAYRPHLVGDQKADLTLHHRCTFKPANVSILLPEFHISLTNPRW